MGGAWRKTCRVKSFVVDAINNPSPTLRFTKVFRGVGASLVFDNYHCTTVLRSGHEIMQYRYELVEQIGRINA